MIMTMTLAEMNDVLEDTAEIEWIRDHPENLAWQRNIPQLTWTASRDIYTCEDVASDRRPVRYARKTERGRTGRQFGVVSSRMGRELDSTLRILAGFIEGVIN